MGNKRDFRGKWEFVLKEQELKALAKLPAGSKCFIMDMGDMFHPDIPWEMITRVFNSMACTPWVTFQVLTKRPGRMAYFAEHFGADTGVGWKQEWPPNIWAGTSVESQKYAPRLDCLARVPAKVRFVSVEPMLGPVDLRKWLNPKITGIWVEDSVLSWVIAGGESGPGARPMHLDWARRLRDDCQAACVPFFFKQWGAWAPFQDNGPLPPHCWYVGLDGNVRAGDAESASDWCMGKVGKKAAGALLDGREWREMPQVMGRDLRDRWREVADEAQSGRPGRDRFGDGSGPV